MQRNLIQKSQGFSIGQNKMVEVFKTNVQQLPQAEMLIKCISEHFHLCKINFDLDDCDKILRVEGINIYPDEIMELVTYHGYNCEILTEYTY